MKSMEEDHRRYDAALMAKARRDVLHRDEGYWIRDVTLGANDGLVSILALLAGVAGALDGRTVLIAGLAGVVAGALSMSLGAYVSSRSFRAFRDHELEKERWEVVHRPDHALDVLRTSLAAKGIEGAALDLAVERITSDEDLWARVLLSEELGLTDEPGRPVFAATIMFVAFAVAGIIPVLPWFFIDGLAAVGASFGVTALALVVAAHGRTRYTGERLVRVSAELVTVAAAGVAVSYGVGRLVGVAV